jgi:nicotinate phosphoribosyltransferase
MIYNDTGPHRNDRVIVDLADVTMRKRIPLSASYRDLLVPVFRQGKLVYAAPSIHRVREFVQSELAHFYAGVKRLLNPHIYPVGLELGLHQLKEEMMQQTRMHVSADEE